MAIILLLAFINIDGTPTTAKPNIRLKSRVLKLLKRSKLKLPTAKDILTTPSETMLELKENNNGLLIEKCITQLLHLLSESKLQKTADLITNIKPDNLKPENNIRLYGKIQPAGKKKLQ